MDILGYTLDIPMTNIEYKLHLNRKTYSHSYLKWHGLLLHPYASSCCSFPQRSSSLTHLSRSTGKMFNQLQRSWWSHYMAVFLLRPRLQLMNSCPESLLPAQKGDFYKDESLHGHCCSGIWIGDHNHTRSHHQSLGRSIQRMVLGTTNPVDSLVDAQIIRGQILLPHDEGLNRIMWSTNMRIMRGNQLLQRAYHILQES